MENLSFYGIEKNDSLEPELLQEQYGNNGNTQSVLEQLLHGVAFNNLFYLKMACGKCLIKFDDQSYHYPASGLTIIPLDPLASLAAAAAAAAAVTTTITWSLARVASAS
ncbi:hypothetical protein E2C01_027261 [Portunus trituberculatus]|uniref:Uncharacterized protein n=1 Tax=Portunus trituberculatus TaxID=210409 RepID=A0A5B7EN99_PORTR|nr:hypothetical protein [Portunus trituberculatus]